MLTSEMEPKKQEVFCGLGRLLDYVPRVHHPKWHFEAVRFFSTLHWHDIT